MSVLINTNFAASLASYNLDRTNSNLQKSLQRLSSGSRINSAIDDAGGLAVSMKLSAALRRSKSAQSNISNSIAFLETQDGVLKTADKVISRMSELATMALDATKNEGDIINYNSEFQKLQEQLVGLSHEKFNGIKMFMTQSLNSTPVATSAESLTVVTSEDGIQSANISIPAINTNHWLNMLINGFVSFGQCDTGKRVFVPNPPQDIAGNSNGVGLYESGEVVDMSQTSSCAIIRTVEEFEIPCENLIKTVTIPSYSVPTPGSTDGSTTIVGPFEVTLKMLPQSPARLWDNSDGDWVEWNHHDDEFAEGDVDCPVVFDLANSTNAKDSITPTYKELADIIRQGGQTTSSGSTITNHFEFNGNAWIGVNGVSPDTTGVISCNTGEGTLSLDVFTGNYTFVSSSPAGNTTGTTGVFTAFNDVVSNTYIRTFVASSTTSRVMAYADSDFAVSNVSDSILDKDSALEFGIIARQALQALAEIRAQNGAEQSRLHFAKDILAVNQVNLEQANSRIMDVDVASESSQLARWNILQQAGTAMLSQANQSTQSILRLISLN